MKDKMKTESVFLDELNPNSRGYKVKVRVIEKNRPKESPQKKVTYQALMLQDDKGHRMKAALFGDQIEGFKDVITYNGEYEIANAIVRPIDDRWKGDPTALDYQMSFGKYTIIQPADGSYDINQPSYEKLSFIPKFADPTDRFDILAVILFVEDGPGKAVTFANRTSKVREFMVLDESVQQPLVISAWHDLAEGDCDLLHATATYLPVIGITALKPSNHKGFSLTTTMSTTIIHQPEGDEARKLQNWVSKNRLSINKMRLKIMALKSDDPVKELSTISSLKSKKAAEVFQDERHTLEVTIPEPEFEKINAYVGCSICGKATGKPLDKPFGCEVCHSSECIATPRVTFKSDIADSTGTLTMTFFTDNCEKLFGITAPEIFHMRQTDAMDKFEVLQKQIQSTTLIIQVAPSTALTKNRVLQWILQKVTVKEVEEETSDQRATTEAAAIEPKKYRSAEKSRPAKRRLILTSGSSTSGESEPEQTLVHHMIATDSTNSDAFKPSESQSPSASPKNPLNV